MTGVQTCALPILGRYTASMPADLGMVLRNVCRPANVFSSWDAGCERVGCLERRIFFSIILFVYDSFTSTLAKLLANHVCSPWDLMSQGVCRIVTPV